MQCPKAILFDLDDTLSPPHIPIEPEMARALERLLAIIPVAVVTAAPFQRIERDVLSRLPSASDLKNLYVSSENGAQCRMRHNDEWQIAYMETISTEEREEIKTAILSAVNETGSLEGIHSYGEQMLDREAGVTFSTLGAGAPQQVRETWDPDLSRRKKLYAAISQKLPHWNVYIGGLTSIDISRHGVSKARAVSWLSEHLRTPASEMLYIGDALYEGGNDHVVIQTGIQTWQTKDPRETLSIMGELLAACTV
jgi:phosphomannomutase